MKPTCRQILDILRQAKGNWVSREFLPAIGGARFGGRIKELRDLGYLIESRAVGAHAWEYRLGGEPDSSPRYQVLQCTLCGWRGDELSAIGWHCPRCGHAVTTPTPQVEPVRQVALL